MRKHRWRAKTLYSDWRPILQNGPTGPIGPTGPGASVQFRCKRCGVQVNTTSTGSPYKECDRQGIPRDCDQALLIRVMES